MIDTGVPGASVALVRADNPSVMTLDGTNSWVFAHGAESYVIDPGPDDAAHIDRLAEAARQLGRPAAVLLTHDHLDHSAGLEATAAALDGVPILRHGDNFSGLPLTALHTPGHAADHMVFHFGPPGRCTLFSGDLILGGSSTIVPQIGRAHV